MNNYHGYYGAVVARSLRKGDVVGSIPSGSISGKLFFIFSTTLKASILNKI